MADSAKLLGFPPNADKNAHTLILGSMPSVKSLGEQQYYAHPQNAFWKIMAELFVFERELEYNKRLSILRKQGIALWDVLRSCRREGSLDSDIEKSSMEPNDFLSFFESHPRIKRVFFNGGKAEEVYRRKVLPKVEVHHRKLVYSRLPSTSPAHASLSYADKLRCWKQAVLDEAISSKERYSCN